MWTIKLLTDPTKKSLNEKFWNPRNPERMESWFYWRSDEYQCIMFKIFGRSHREYLSSVWTPGLASAPIRRWWRSTAGSDTAGNAETRSTPSPRPQTDLCSRPHTINRSDRHLLTYIQHTHHSHLRSYGACVSTATVLIWPRPHIPLSAALLSAGSASASPSSQCCVSAGAAALWLAQTADQNAESQH